MREYPDTIPEAYQADKALADAYKNGWLMAARLEDLAKDKLDWEVCTADAQPDQDWHFWIWWELVREEQRRHWRFDDREVEEAFDKGAETAIKAGLAAYTDADYEMLWGDDA